MSIAGPNIPDQSPFTGPELQTERLTLRPLRISDRAEFLRVYAVSADHFAPWLPSLADMGARNEVEYFETQVLRAAAGIADGSSCRLAAFDHQANLVGTFNLNNIVRGVFQNAYAGWQVSADQIRRGYAVEAIRADFTQAFAPREQGGLGLHRLQAANIPSN
ncbi:MAG: GNAT family N-acetyltransferase, partial [Phycisphaerales bacterium]